MIKKCGLCGQEAEIKEVIVNNEVVFYECEGCGESWVTEEFDSCIISENYYKWLDVFIDLIQRT